MRREFLWLKEEKVREIWIFDDKKLIFNFLISRNGDRKKFFKCYLVTLHISKKLKVNSFFLPLLSQSFNKRAIAIKRAVWCSPSRRGEEKQIEAHDYESDIKCYRFLFPFSCVSHNAESPGGKARARLFHKSFMLKISFMIVCLLSLSLAVQALP